MHQIDTKKPFTFDRVIRITITIGIVFGILYLFNLLSDVLIPFFIAFLLAYLINPLTNYLHKKIKFRVLSVIVSLLLIFGVIFLAFWLIIPQIAYEVKHFGNMVNSLVSNSETATNFSNRLPEKIDKIYKDILESEQVKTFFQSNGIAGLIEKLVGKILPGVWGIITGTATILTGLVGISIIFLYLIFILIDYKKINDGWKELIPQRFKSDTIEFVHDFESIMNKYFRGQALVALINGVLAAIGFSIIGLPMGILLGLFIGLLNMVPYLQLLGYIPALFLIGIQSLETGTSFWIILGLVILILTIIQLISDLILVPIIMGKVTGFNPAMIILSLTVWGKLLGFLGLIIALPLTYLILAYYRRIILGINVKIENEPEEPDLLTDEK